VQVSKQRGRATVRTAVVVTHSGSGVPRYFGRGTQPASIFRTSSCTGPGDRCSGLQDSSPRRCFREPRAGSLQVALHFRKGRASSSCRRIRTASLVRRGSRCATRSNLCVQDSVPGEPAAQAPTKQSASDRLPAARPPSPVLYVPELCKRGLQQLVLLHAVPGEQSHVSNSRTASR